MKTLKTERLVLRDWRETDLEDFYEYAKNPNVGPNAGWRPHNDKAESLKILKEFIKNDDVWAVTEKPTGKAIGSLGLHKDGKRENDKARMIGYVLSEPYWGKGLMTEAVKRVLAYSFEELGLEIVTIFHFSFNQRSKRVIEKCGFNYEGTLRMAVRLFDGRVCDDVCYSITKDEYFSANTPAVSKKN